MVKDVELWPQRPGFDSRPGQIFFTKMPHPCGTFLRQTLRPLACKIRLDRPCPREELFADYVSNWLKIKQESAGYPSWAVTPEDKVRYVRLYQQKELEGIALEPSLIQKNPGRKATAKLMLNKFWGQFGENLHKPTTEAV